MDKKCPYYQGVCSLNKSILCYTSSEYCDIYKEHENNNEPTDEHNLVAMNPRDWEICEYEAKITCPHCHKKDSYFSYDNWFHDKVFNCKNCGKDFHVYCED